MKVSNSSCQKSPRLTRRFLSNFYNTFNSYMRGFIYRKCKFSISPYILILSDLFELALSLINANQPPSRQLSITKRAHQPFNRVESLLAPPGECKGNESKGKTRYTTIEQ